LPPDDDYCPVAERAFDLVRRLRPSPVMTQARNAMSRKINDLLGRPLSGAGQKTRVGWQALPGADETARDAKENHPCR